MSCKGTLPKEVVLEALRCCRDVYPHEQDFLVSRKVEGHTILAVEGTNETTDWITNLKFLIKRDDCHRGFKNNANRTLAQLVVAYEGLNPERKLVIAGHSLGGATATLIADLLWESGNTNIALITAGSPRPGGQFLTLTSIIAPKDEPLLRCSKIKSSHILIIDLFGEKNGFLFINPSFQLELVIFSFPI